MRTALPILLAVLLAGCDGATQQWERVSEQMANTARTIDGVTKRLEAISKDLYSRERRV